MRESHTASVGTAQNWLSHIGVVNVVARDVCIVCAASGLARRKSCPAPRSLAVPVDCSPHTQKLMCLQVCDNDEQKMGADIVRKALPYALKLIAHNAGVNGSVVMDKVLSKSDDVNWGYNAASDTYEDLMKVGIIDPTKVCWLRFHSVCNCCRRFYLSVQSQVWLWPHHARPDSVMPAANQARAKSCVRWFPVWRAVR